MLTEEEILNAAEDVLRQYGPEKAAVVDVARVLDVSHGTIYRHFASKEALWGAVARRWLQRIEQPLKDIADEEGAPDRRLYRWVKTLATLKQSKRREDPRMFATYYALAESAEGVVQSHVAVLIDQLGSIIAEGRERGVFAADDPETAARAVFDATSRFHHPARSGEWDDSNLADQFESVWDLLLAGLQSAEG